MVVLTITVIKKIASIFFSLTFLQCNGLNDFSLASEPIVDLISDILRNESWELSDIHSSLQPELCNKNEQYDNPAPFGTANKLFVATSFHPAVADGYINDIVTAMIDKVDWVLQGQIQLHWQ